MTQFYLMINPLTFLAALALSLEPGR